MGATLMCHLEGHDSGHCPVGRAQLMGGPGHHMCRVAQRLCCRSGQIRAGWNGTVATRRVPMDYPEQHRAAAVQSPVDREVGEGGRPSGTPGGLGDPSPTLTPQHPAALRGPAPRVVLPSSATFGSEVAPHRCTVLLPPPPLPRPEPPPPRARSSPKRGHRPPPSPPGLPVRGRSGRAAGRGGPVPGGREWQAGGSGLGGAAGLPVSRSGAGARAAGRCLRGARAGPEHGPGRRGRAGAGPGTGGCPRQGAAGPAVPEAPCGGRGRRSPGKGEAVSGRGGAGRARCEADGPEQAGGRGRALPGPPRPGCGGHPGLRAPVPRAGAGVKLPARRSVPAWRGGGASTPTGGRPSPRSAALPAGHRARGGRGNPAPSPGWGPRAHLGRARRLRARPSVPARGHPPRRAPGAAGTALAAGACPSERCPLPGTQALPGRGTSARPRRLRLLHPPPPGAERAPLLGAGAGAPVRGRVCVCGVRGAPPAPCGAARRYGAVRAPPRAGAASAPPLPPAPRTLLPRAVPGAEPPPSPPPSPPARSLSGLGWLRTAPPRGQGWPHGTPGAVVPGGARGPAGGRLPDYISRQPPRRRLALALTLRLPLPVSPPPLPPPNRRSQRPVSDPPPRAGGPPRPASARRPHGSGSRCVPAPPPPRRPAPDARPPLPGHPGPSRPRTHRRGGEAEGSGRPDPPFARPGGGLHGNGPGTAPGVAAEEGEGGCVWGGERPAAGQRRGRRAVTAPGPGGGGRPGGGGGLRSLPRDGTACRCPASHRGSATGTGGTCRSRGGAGGPGAAGRGAAAAGAQRSRDGGARAFAEFGGAARACPGGRRARGRPRRQQLRVPAGRAPGDGGRALPGGSAAAAAAATSMFGAAPVRQRGDPAAAPGAAGRPVAAPRSDGERPRGGGGGGGATVEAERAAGPGGDGRRWEPGRAAGLRGRSRGGCGIREGQRARGELREAGGGELREPTWGSATGPGTRCGCGAKPVPGRGALPAVLRPRRGAVGRGSGSRRCRRGLGQGNSPGGPSPAASRGVWAGAVPLPHRRSRSGAVGGLLPGPESVPRAVVGHGRTGQGLPAALPGGKHGLPRWSIGAGSSAGSILTCIPTCIPAWAGVEHGRHCLAAKLGVTFPEAQLNASISEESYPSSVSPL
ncbi:collagen alpha-1(I) chain-like [Heliangelus exortis]|uniref:collagen alpha-1(I) chain-like n=1 Tax=Heliangelus exortis TaxID=472823 RepID=UPI003A8CF30A